MPASCRPRNREAGTALLLALVTTALVTAVAAGLIVSVSTETAIAGNSRAAQEALYAADAVLERALRDLALVPDWSAVLASPPASVASFDDGLAVARAPDGRPLAIGALTAARQAASVAAWGAGAFGADTPVWRPYGHATLAAVLPPGLVSQPAYALVWVADDGLDGDGDPATDANGQILLHVEAYGVNGSRRGIAAEVSRAGGAVRLLSWKDLR